MASAAPKKEAGSFQGGDPSSPPPKPEELLGQPLIFGAALTAHTRVV